MKLDASTLAFEKAIFDETTTYNGTPLKKYLGNIIYSKLDT